jgi:hypothetical protein
MPELWIIAIQKYTMAKNRKFWQNPGIHQEKAF